MEVEHPEEKSLYYMKIPLNEYESSLKKRLNFRRPRIDVVAVGPNEPLGNFFTITLEQFFQTYEMIPRHVPFRF